MTVLVRNVTLELDDGADTLARKAAKSLRVGQDRLEVERVVKRSLDARRGRPPRYLYTLAVKTDPSVEQALLSRKRTSAVPYEPDVYPVIEKLGSEAIASSQSAVSLAGSRPRPVVIGAGPAGLLAAYRLVQAGLEPLIVDRGLAVKERSKEWYAFLKGGAFNSESNLLYGEGGAGTYSDGKLYTRVHDIRTQEVLDLLVECGAPAEIAYEAKPHIGSNLLPSIVRRLRERLIERGAEFRFSTCMVDLHIDSASRTSDDRSIAVGVELRPGGSVAASAVFLAPGHSARDTLRLLLERGVAMEPKPFQLGVRIEHPQPLVNQLQYGKFAEHPNLPPADYRLVQKTSGGDVFSFCMCPGGEILPATEREGFICVNGASRHKRIGDFANSGFVVTLDPGRFRQPGTVLGGLLLQEEIESKAAAVATHAFGAPALRLIDLIERRISSDLPASSYPLPLTAAPFEEFMPEDILGSIREGLDRLTQRLPLLRDPEAIVVGPEARSSSPIRMVRDPSSLESTSVAGLYPMGEGAGYAGGIMSAALDGMRCVETWLERVRTRS